MTIRGFRSHCPQDDASEAPRGLSPFEGCPIELATGRLGTDLACGPADERRLAGQQEVEQTPMGDDVSGGSDPRVLSPCLLGGHELQGAGGRAVPALGPSVANLGQAEVDQPWPAGRVDHDVLGRDVLVHHPLAVDVLHGPRQLGHQGGRPARSRRT
jgi:hypothetical protein